MKLICYLSNGYPSIESSKILAQQYVDAGCDIIEIDFPARDPFLESHYLVERMKTALSVCGDYEKYMEGMADIRRKLPNTKFILLIYEATLLEIGYDRFIEFCRENGFGDMILAGNKDDTVKEKLIADGMGVSQYVQFQILPAEVDAAKNSNGFVYMQGKPAEGQENPDYPTLKDCIAYLRAQGVERPIYCGVGIHTPADAQMAKEAGADGIFIGSAILNLQDDVPAMKKMIRTFKEQY